MLGAQSIIMLGGESFDRQNRGGCLSRYRLSYLAFLLPILRYSFCCGPRLFSFIYTRLFRYYFAANIGITAKMATRAPFVVPALKKHTATVIMAHGLGDRLVPMPER